MNTQTLTGKQSWVHCLGPDPTLYERTAFGALIERNLLPEDGGIDPGFRQLLIDETEIAPLGVVRG